MTDTSRKPLDRGQKQRLWLLVTICGLFILFFRFQFQEYIAEGDHGRDLYCFWQTQQGALPYRDFSWPFGPLMPYYYGVFLRFLGPAIQNVLLGQNILILASGLVIFAIGRVFLPTSFAFLPAIYYWSFRETEFFYTYNHNGAVLTMLATLLFFMLYARQKRQKYIIGGMAGILLTMLIRLNMGVFLLLWFIISLLFINHRTTDPSARNHRRTLLWTTLAVVSLTSLIYFWLLAPLETYEIRECFPYFKSDRTDAVATVGDGFRAFCFVLLATFTKSIPRTFMGLVLLLSPGYLLFRVKKGQVSAPISKEIKDTIIPLFFLLILLCHEFIGSGIMYRLYWTISFFWILLFYLIVYVIRTSSAKALQRPVQILLLLTLTTFPLLRVHRDHMTASLARASSTLFSNGPTRVYTFHNQQRLKTLNAISGFLKKNLKDDETFWALPFDPLFFFLTGKISPTRQLIVFKHKNLPEEQERKIIAEIDSKKVRYLLLSKRALNPDESLGVLGKTHGFLLVQYIRDNFHTVARFGDWTRPAGWASNYGAEIWEKND